MKKKPLLLISALILAGLGACYFGPEHQRFLAFDADREKWHRDCDAAHWALGNTPSPTG
jgi:hypothetical protein